MDRRGLDRFDVSHAPTVAIVAIEGCTRRRDREKALALRGTSGKGPPLFLLPGHRRLNQHGRVRVK